MAYNSWDQTVITAASAGTAVTNTLTATTLLPPAAKYTLPANYLSVGSRIRVKAGGKVSTVVTTPGTLTLDLRFGSSTVIFNGGAMALNTTAQTNQTWTYEAYLTCLTTGTSATIQGIGEWRSRAVIGAGAAGSTGIGALLLPETSPTTGTTFDSTASQTLDFYATWSVANASNSITLLDFSVETMN